MRHSQYQYCPDPGLRAGDARSLATDALYNDRPRYETVERAGHP